MAAHKVSFSFTLFFLSLSLLTVGLTSSRGARALLHNGLWIVKTIVLVAVIVAVFVVPISHLGGLHTAWVYSSLAGNWAFMMVRLNEALFGDGCDGWFFLQGSIGDPA